MQVSIRHIQSNDNAILAEIIRDTLTEFDANYPGTVYFDPSTDHLYEVFQKERSVYYVAEKNSSIVGGAGIYPTDELSADVCELVKMYLLPQARGEGLGKDLD